MSSNERVSIKGTSDGVIITIGSGDWQTILDQVARKLGQRSSFFKGGRVALSVGKRLLDAPQIETMGELLSEQQMTLWAVNSTASKTCEAAKSLGLEAELKSASSNGAVAVAKHDSEAETAQTIRRTLRSGQTVEHPGTVIVVGDVNPGAKIVAGRNVIIWGRLRGTVHAGAIIAEDAFVCALELSPMQLIIGTIISRAPADGVQGEIIPEMAFVQDGQIVAEAWQ